MDQENFPFYRTLTFKFLASAALFIVLIESILLVLSIQGMEDRLLSVRNIVLRNLDGSTVEAEQILSDETIQSIIYTYTRNIIVMVGTIVAVVLAGLYFVVQYWFIDPLQTILEKNRATKGSDSVLLIDEKDMPNDEIGAIMQSRNEMLTTIQTLYNEEALETLREAVDAKDEYTEGHSRRVGQVASVLGERLDLAQKTCEQLQYAGLLHDVGKIAVSEAILTKDGTLTDEEFSEIQTHPARGEKIIQFSSIDERILKGVRHHHEQYDGSGYPDRIEGEEIPLFGRILAVADAMDAMLSDRHYRNALDWEEVESELADNRGTQFDPEVADQAIKLVRPSKRNLLPPSTIDDHERSSTIFWKCLSTLS